jgi:hypothetical protein
MIGEDLLTIVTAALEASSLARVNTNEQAWDLVNSFVAEAKLRIDHAISELRGHNEDDLPTAIGRQTVRGNYEWLSHGIISRCLRQYLPTSLGNRPHPLK